jgi:transcriptional regulator with XRE-family HTH domain
LTLYHYGVGQPRHVLLRTIGLSIRARRRARGLSQESLAALAELDRSYMSSVERGLRNISVLNLARIAAALETSVWELLGSRDLPLALIAHSLETRTPAPPAPPARREDNRLTWRPGHYLSLG